MKQNTEKKKFSRRTFLLSGLLAALGSYFGYTRRDKILPWIKYPYVHCIDNRPNIIMIAMDTLRADHLGCYGYERGISPNIDSFAKDSVLYWNTMSQSNWTLPAFASLFTSLYPHQHVTGMLTDRVTKVYQTTLPRVFTTLADVLSDEGYHAIAVTGGAYVSKEAGMNKGFDEFHQIKRNMQKTPNDLPWQLEKSSNWIKRHYRSKKFFLFIHSYECHYPYFAPERYLDMLDPDYDGPPLTGDIKPYLASLSRELYKVEKERFKTLYDAEIKYSDDLLGDFFVMLKDKGIYDDSLIIFLSDHGAQFWEHGRWGHNCPSGMYEEVLRVPIIIKYPGGYPRGENQNRVARLVDIMPTILLDILDLGGMKLKFEGVPFSESLDDRISISESCMSYKGIDLFAFRNQDIKYVVNKRGNKLKSDVFNLREDPGELRDLATVYESDLRRISASAGEAEMIYLRNMKEMNYPVSVDEDTLKMLKDLGYVQ